uniref:Uncharacterized mitochondrial protein AtMg00810-like n=1 Tax=Tanacetum cinerariifolium TaxID=118510 RepID=A0A6L2J1S6_TANCI|nr:uncharacterized mitochondrial protein AtMg00810-like [Tanacetum cinerariifolium]
MAAVEVPQTLEYKDFQDNPDDEEDIRSSHEYLNDIEEEYQAGDLLAKSKGFFKKGTQSSIISITLSIKISQFTSAQTRTTKDFKAKYNKVKAKLALLSLSASASKASTVKNKGLIVEAYEWDEEEVSSDHNEKVEVKVLMDLAEDNDAVSNEGARNEQKNNLLSHRDLVHELNAYKEQLLVLKQEKLDFLIMQHINTKILKENKNLRNELKELTTITETWLNSFKKVNQCISEQIPSQKKRVLGVDQLTEDPSSSRILPVESQRNTTNPSVAVTDTSSTKYDSSNESSVCSTHFPPLKKLNGTEPTSEPKTIKSILSVTSGSPSGPKVVFEDDSTCTTEGYGSIKCNGIVFTKFDEKRGTIFNSNKEVVMIAPRVRDVYVLDMTSSAQDSCFFAKVSENLNWRYFSPRYNFNPNPPLPIPSVVTLAPQDRWSQEKHTELVNIIRNPEARMLTRAMAKKLSVASAHEYLFVDFLSKEKPKKIKQSERCISINQEKYVKDLLKKYDINGSSVKTPMVSPDNLGPDLSGKAVNETKYRGMIGSLMYLTASRPDIRFLTFHYARYQANPKESHLIVVKIIFRKSTPGAYQLL